jgi:uncharacterized membrane protein YraQ (UPF0718 family)
MLTFEAASLGLPFTLVRLSLSIIGIFIIALVTEKSLNAAQQSEVYKLNQE